MNNLKDKIITIAAVALLVVFVFLFIKEKIEHHLDVAEMKAALTGNPASDVAPQKIYIDNSGNTHVNTQDKATKDIAGTFSGSAYKYITDTLTKALKIKTKQIDELTRVNAELTGILKAKQVQYDSIGNILMSFKSKYMNAVVNTQDSTLSYTYDANIDVAKYHTGSWLVGSNKHYIDVSSQDSSLRIYGMKHYRKEIGEENPFFNLGVQANVVYHFTEARNYEINLGLHAEFNPYGRFSPQINAGYNYDPNTDAERFHPYLRAGVMWNIIRH